VLVSAALLAVLVPVARSLWTAWQRRAEAQRVA